MTSKQCTPPVTKRSSVIPLSKSWKENLRKACLNRVRNNRRQFMMCSSEENLAAVHRTTPTSLSSSDGVTKTPIRFMVEDEMRRNGIIVESPCYNEESIQQQQQQQRIGIHSLLGSSCEYDNCDNNNDDDHHHPMMIDSSTHQQQQRHDNNNNNNNNNITNDHSNNTALLLEPVANHYITEEELFDLLEEIEDEIQKEQMKYLEQMIDIANQDLEEQIADYEQWEEEQQQQSEFETTTKSITVQCPICEEANLIWMPSSGNGTIVCPNHIMDRSCSMILENISNNSSSTMMMDDFDNNINNNNQFMILEDFQNRLRISFEQHSMKCNKIPSVSVIQNNDNNNDKPSSVIGYCDSCVSEFIIF